MTTQKIVTRKAAQGQVKHWVLALVGVAFAGCHNYTTAPLCSDSNATQLRGMTGKYTISLQREDFTVETKEIEVTAEAKGKLKMRSVDAAGFVKEEESRLCSINGITISENKVKDQEWYQQSSVHVTNVGFSSHPVFFDRAQLEADGVAVKIVEMPEAWLKRAWSGAKSLFKGQRLLEDGDEEPTLALVIDSENVSPALLMNSAHQSPLSLTFLRK